MPKAVMSQPGRGAAVSFFGGLSGHGHGRSGTVTNKPQRRRSFVIERGIMFNLVALYMCYKHITISEHHRYIHRFSIVSRDRKGSFD